MNVVRTWITKYLEYENYFSNLNFLDNIFVEKISIHLHYYHVYINIFSSKKLL